MFDPDSAGRCACVMAGALMLDLVLRGGSVIDGTGGPARRLDVGVRDGRLVLGDNATSSPAVKKIDVTGLVLCPGFVDMHVHSDLAMLREPAAEHAIAQGVTCEVIGQDGLSYAPIEERILDDLHAQIGSVYGPPPDDGFSWRSVAEFLTRLDGAAINVCYLAPHGTIRRLVMGTEDRPAQPHELDAMCSLLEQALREGAVGLSTGLTYAPAMYASIDELVSLCTVVARHGGFYAPHHRSYGLGAIEAYAECIDVSRASGVALHLTHAHLSFPVNRGRAAELLALVDDAVADGMDITLDSYPYIAGSSYLHAFLPGWAQSCGSEQLLRSLKDPTFSERIGYELEVTGCDGSHGVPVDWETVVICGVGNAANNAAVGLSVAELAARRGLPPFEAYRHLLLDDRLGATCLVMAGNEENVRIIMQHARHMAGSDGLLVGQRPHPRGFGTFARYLAHYARDEGLIPLPEMVRKMTSAPARRLGLGNRGVIAEGMAADLVCFDPETIQDRATYEAPRTPPDGVEYVIVNGAVVLDDGRHTGALAGHALRRQRTASVS